MSRPARATIHMGAMRANLARMRALAPRSKVMAMLKADAYGHGIERAARALQDADAFGVAALQDAERLRQAGFEHRVVWLCGFNEEFDLPALRAMRVEPVVHHEAQLRILEAERGGGEPLPVWLKIDTGMHRLGFAPEKAQAVHARLRALPNVRAEIALMTHFASSDEFESDATREQIARFEAATRGLDGPRTLANSAAVLGWPQSHGDWIRPGGALYGVSPRSGTSGADFGLQPAMTLSTRLISINSVARGGQVGYGGTYTCPEDMPVGIAAIGYGDGYPRHAGTDAPVLVNGVRVPTCGRVSMDMLAIDLRRVPQARVGDEVVLWGRELPVEEIAAKAGTIGYELTCGITRRVPFIED